MADEKPKRKTHTSNEVKRRYNEKTYDRLQLVVPKGKKDAIRNYAISNGESLNSFVNRAIDETMEREQAKGVESND
jgi:predicted HicB family RNase H-like nuclease